MSSRYDSGIEEIRTALSGKSYELIPGDRVKELLLERSENALADLGAFRESWSRMPLDGYMADGGRYRRRRHATLSAPRAGDDYRVEDHQPHYQTLDYNNLNGGIARHYKPFEAEILRGNTMDSLVRLGAGVFGGLAPYSGWHIEAHQFRIEVNGQEVGRPTPEGVHRDGVTFVLMAMIGRNNAIGGESTIFNLEKSPVEKFTLAETLDIALVNDERVFHGVSPVEQLDPETPASRDVLVITYRHKP
ncbi:MULTISPECIES: 2OG-Fe dioxygenase family protein [unclassified Streptomyces]|uniref:2OG-Fe dioxygenase family protein n=1 Tax=unclassified Streptomyces TaxID=2593676 RepID=UPI00190B3709|nr:MULTISPECIES: 2OG-Fe dioxygenase family protein [unclassified Streptomyces]MBK3568483.1 2OG-Fe dioxygenase family protein [Streptomyces sp. MBT62]MBK6015433.1 2OG-Fe dioxygenase family protein [Streptomyces sp. MBT53]